MAAAYWKARGWQTADRKPVKNQDLWQRLDELAAAHRLEWHWVPGHAGVPATSASTGSQTKRSTRSQCAASIGRLAPMRQIVLDTETTGLEPELDHRIIEIGCIELLNRRPTGRTFHRYLNPERDIDEGALAVHGITRTDLERKPRFARDRRGAARVHRRCRARDPQRGVRRRVPRR